MLYAQMPIGPQMPLIERAFRDIPFIFRAPSSLGLLLSRSQSLYLLRRQSTTLWPMPLRRLFGFALSLAYYAFRYLDHSLFLVIIKLHAPCRTRPQFLLVQNILMFVIISYATMFKPVHSRLRGYRRKICQRTYLRNLCPLLFFLVIATYLVCLLRYYNLFLYFYFSLSAFSFSFTLFLSLLRPDGGVLALGSLGQDVT